MRGFSLPIADNVADKMEVFKKFVIRDGIIGTTTTRVTILPKHICPVSVDFAQDAFRYFLINSAYAMLQLSLKMLKPS